MRRVSLPQPWASPVTSVPCVRSAVLPVYHKWRFHAWSRAATVCMRDDSKSRTDGSWTRACPDATPLCAARSSARRTQLAPLASPLGATMVLDALYASVWRVELTVVALCRRKSSVAVGPASASASAANTNRPCETRPQLAGVHDVADTLQHWGVYVCVCCHNTAAAGRAYSTLGARTLPSGLYRLGRTRVVADNRATFRGCSVCCEPTRALQPGDSC